MIRIITFYKFIELENCEELQKELKNKMLDLSVKGTITLSSEGINATISGSIDEIQEFWQYLTTDVRFTDLKFKESFFERQPFKRTKVKIKKELISLGAPVNVQAKVGQYVTALDWNNLIQDSNVAVIDTRNEYEIEFGQFKGALNPQTNNFKELAKFIENNLDNFQNKKIAMYCTGGIRCEKFSSYLLQKGFEEVYHLQGGILQYLEDIPREQSLWQGSCFVFDERVAVQHT